MAIGTPERAGVANASEAEAVLARHPLERVAERFAADFDLPSEMATRIVGEMKRFLTLCALHPRTHYGMRGIVDDAWHTFMIFSRDYTAFCSDLAGDYIHHEPEERGDPTENPSERLARSRDSYRKTLTDYQEVFGHAPPADIWPQLVDARSLPGNSCQNGCGNSCSKCGSGCSSCGHGCTRCNRCGSR